MQRRRRDRRVCYHKHARRYYVTLDRKAHYLSHRRPKERRVPHEVQAEADRVIAAWLLERGKTRPVAPDPSIAELWEGYLAHATERYVKNGRQTSEVACIRDACKVVARLYGTLPAREFSPKKLQAVRQCYVDAGWERQYINKQVSRVRRMFRWGVAEELVPEATWRALQAVTDLRAHKGIREGKPVSAASDADIDAVVTRLPASLRALVRFHRAAGCRADEATIARPMDFTRHKDEESPTGEMWLYVPSSSKNDASYWVGPRGQEVLAPLIAAAASPSSWLFPTRRRGAGHWSTASYRRAVTRACARLDTPVYWTPLQVRHAAAEEARKGHPKGLEATQARLAHKEMQVSQKYAHDLSELGREVARRFG